MAGQRIGDERQHRRKDGQRHGDALDGVAYGQEDLDGVDLALPDLPEALQETALPAEELDEPDSLQDLLGEGDPLVGELVDALPPPDQHSDGVCEQRHPDHQQRIPGQGAVADVDKQEDQGGDDGDRRGPEDVEHPRRGVDPVRIDAHQRYDPSVAPAPAVPGDACGNVCCDSGATFPVLQEIILGRLQVLDSLPARFRTARQLHRLGKDHVDQHRPRLATHDHASVDELARGQALERLHARDADSDPDAMADGRAVLTAEPGHVRVRGERDQVASRVGREDLQQGREELADAADPELPLERVVHGPQQRIGVSALHASLERRLELLGQDIDQAVRVDLPDVLVFQRSQVAHLESR